MTIQPIVFAACYILGALLLAAFLLLDEIYLGSFFSTWHLEFAVIPMLWFAFGHKVHLPESALKLLLVLLMFPASVYILLPIVVLPGVAEDSWPQTAIQSIILLTGMAIGFVLLRRFNIGPTGINR